MVCRKCGAEIKDGDMFCARCGTRTEKAESSSQGYYQTEERTVICKYCGKLIPEKSVGCPYCGKIIGKQYSRPTSDRHKERDNPAGFGILAFCSRWSDSSSILCGKMIIRKRLMRQAAARFGGSYSRSPQA